MRYNGIMKPLGKIEIKWSPEFAYAIGLLVTDGNLSPDGRHINFTSKDKELIQSFCECLNINNKIGLKARDGGKDKKYFVVQFGDVNFYQFLLDIGLAPKKSKIISKIDIQDKYIWDFLRGHFDGDGTFYSYWDPRWESSFMFYMEFISASQGHIDWLRNQILEKLSLKGHITTNSRRPCYQLKYAKAESLKLFSKLYYDKHVVCLRRKRVKIEKALRVNERHINKARVL